MVEVITRTPYRISFFGGGTDYPAWYLEHGGAVLSTTIDRYCYLTFHFLPPFFGIKHKVVWSHIEAVNSFGEILHPAVREGLRMLNFDEDIGVEIHHQGDLPARSGMGSSSAFSAGLILGLTALRGEKITRKELLAQCLKLEQQVLKESVGSQDQTAAVYGGFNRIEFLQSGEIKVHPIAISLLRKRALNAKLMMFFAGTTRLSQQIAAGVVKNMQNTSEHLFKMRAMVDQAEAILCDPNGNLDDFGALLHQSWQLKRQLSSDVSNTHIDDIYDRAMRAGAIGGKLLGAGASGVMLFYVPEPMQQRVREALGNLIEIEASLDDKGAHVLFDRCQRKTIFDE